MVSIMEKTKVKKPIKIHINSYGGSVDNGFAMIGIVEQLKEKGYDIHTIVTGKSMSMGAMLLLSGSKRFAYKYADVMFHSAWNYTNPYEPSTYKSKKFDLEQSELLLEKFKKYISKNCELDISKFQKMVDTDTDWHMNVEQAKKYNIIQEIL